MSSPYTEQNTHSALPNTSHDELSRQHFVRSFKEHIVESLHPGLKLAYEKRARPQYVAKHQREPETIQEVGEVMKKDPHYQAWSSLLRTSQEMMWSSTQIPVERAIVDLAAQSADNTLGSLTLNPNLEIPTTTQPSIFTASQAATTLSTSTMTWRRVLFTTELYISMQWGNWVETTPIWAIAPWHG